MSNIGDFYGVRLKPHWKKFLMGNGIALGCGVLLGIGYALPHPQPIKYVPKVVTKTETKYVDNCPAGPFIVQSYDGWKFFTHKDTGCVFGEFGGENGTTVLKTVADPKGICAKF